MNKKGQSLIIFVLLLPILLLFSIYIIIACNGYLEKNHLSLSIRDNLQIIVNKDLRDLDKIEENIINNNPDAKINIILSDNILKVNAISVKKGFFDKVYKFPQIEINICGNYDTKKVYECS